MAKIGTLVTITGGTDHHRFEIGKVVKIFRHVEVALFKYYDCCDDDGNCSLVSVKDVSIFNLNNRNNMKAMKQAVLDTAKKLCKANNTVTTLEIKLELRRDYPYFYWTQDTVSKYMAQFAGDGVFMYTDNGTYRTYSLAPTVTTVTALSGKGSSGLGSTGVAGSYGYVGAVMPSYTRRVKMKLSKKVGKTKKTRTSLNQKYAISRSSIPLYLTRSNFQGVQLANGNFVDVSNIKRQKKSITGYVTPKLHSITAIKVGGDTLTII